MVMWFSHTQPMPRQMGHFLFVMEGVPNEYLRVCPETSGRIAEFSEHEAD
jgi:hypothetical protein